MQIVAMLSEQLDGALELDSRKGTAFLLTFNELRYRERI
jgi:two-component sensor histidine kinase